MLRKNWKTYAFWSFITEAVGALSGLLSRSGTKLYSQTVEKPPLSPPGIVFPIVWTLLFALMGISAARVRLAPASKARAWSTNLYIAQLILNFFWPLIFFNLQAFGLALLWLILLWISVFVWIFVTARVDKPAAWLLLPYLVWLTFATYLNAGVFLLN